MGLKNYSEAEELMESKYLENNIYNGLKNLNNGFDAKSIYYFSESDFEIVLNRIEENGIAIFGIEPWLDGHYYDCVVFEEYEKDANDPKWYVDETLCLPTGLY